MKTLISPNKKELVGRIILQLFLMFFLCFAAYNLWAGDLKQDQTGKYWAYLAIAVFGNLAFIPQLLFLPFWVLMDKGTKTLQIKYLLLRSKTIGLKDIAHYRPATIPSRSISYFGIILCLSNDKWILLSEANIADYTAVELFLIEQKIEKKGEEDFSFLTYYFHQ